MKEQWINEKSAKTFPAFRQVTGRPKAPKKEEKDKSK